MQRLFKKLAATVAAIPLAFVLTISLAQADKIKLALAEVPSDELAAFFVALDRVKACRDGLRMGGFFR